MTRPLCLALLALACGDPLNMHPPSLLEPCPRAVVEVYTAAEGECLKLESVHDTLFRLESSDSCGGPSCLRLEPGETGYALERLRPAEPAVWSWHAGPCDVVPPCPTN